MKGETATLHLRQPKGDGFARLTFPILRSGRIASFPLVPTSTTMAFLLDFPVFSGTAVVPCSCSIRIVFMPAARTLGLLSPAWTRLTTKERHRDNTITRSDAHEGSLTRDSGCGARIIHQGRNESTSFTSTRCPCKRTEVGTPNTAVKLSVPAVTCLALACPTPACSRSLRSTLDL